MQSSNIHIRDKLPEFDLLIDQMYPPTQTSSEPFNPTYFPRVVTEWDPDLQLSDWKHASNPKEVASFAGKLFQSLHYTSITPNRKLKHLQHLKTLVKNYTDYCEQNTETNWIKKIMAFFGVGKRAGLNRAREMEQTLDKEIETYQKLIDLPTYQEDIQDKNAAEKMLDTLQDNSSLVWAHPDGRVFQSSLQVTSQSPFPDKIAYLHQEYADPIQFFEQPQIKQTANTPLTDAQLPARKVLINYNKIKDSFEYKATYDEDPVRMSTKEGFVLAEAQTQALMNRQPILRIMPAKNPINPDAVKGFTFMIVKPRDQSYQNPIVEKYYVEPQPEGYKVKFPPSEPDSQPVERTYTSIETFVQETGTEIEVGNLRVFY